MSHTKTGVLVIAHGSRNTQWIEQIDQAVYQATEQWSLGLPMTVGYLELVEGRSIADGVHHLEAQGVRKIIVVPLFVSSGSTHLEEIKYSLGVIEQSRIPTELAVIPHQCEIIWSEAMDAHPYVIEIILEQLQHLTQAPEQEHLLLLAHGSDVTGFQEQWEDMLHSIRQQISPHFPFKSVSFATLHPDTIREKVILLSHEGSVILLPLFISRGYFTNELIPKKLENIPCRYQALAYLPHPLISRWIEEKVKLHVK